MKFYKLQAIWLYSLLVVSICGPLQPLGAAIVPANLQCGLVANPLGVDDLSLRLSWQLQATTFGERGQAQSAYQILVASSSSLLDSDRGDLWDSRKVSSDLSLGIAYAGAPLASEQQAFWKVRVWDQNDQPSIWSSSATWTMGLRGMNDWGARWLCAPPASSLPIFRREFVVKPGLQRAMVYICGLGQYELSANGLKVGSDLLSPGWSKYNKTCLYDTFDLTSSLTPGANVISVMLGNGMYNVQGSSRYAKFTGSFGPPKFIARLHLYYQDGTSDVIYSDTQWRTIHGPITFSSVYGGEDYDARLEPMGWKLPGFDASRWLVPNLTEGPGGLLKGLSCAAPPLHAFEVLKPVRATPIQPNVTVYDLGQNASVIARIQVKGPRGSVVRIIPAELKQSNGRVDRESVGGGDAWWQYTLAGTGDESWFSKFFYHGCRYFQVECRPAANGQLPVVENVAGVVVGSASDTIGKFSCSDGLFNRTHGLIRWAQRANLVSVLTDCPHRERLGWLEQYHLNGPSLRYEFDLSRLFTKGMNDMADSQQPNGLVPSIAPEYPVFEGGFRDSPEWGSAFVIVPWQQYQFTGDRELLCRYYDGMKRYVAYLGARSRNNLLDYGLGDWYDLGPNPPGYSQLTPAAVTASAFYFYDNWVLAQTAALLDRSDDARKFAAQAAAIRSAFNRKFFNSAGSHYANGSQCANALPLVMNICEPGNRRAVLDAIVSDIRQHGNTAGDVGYRYLLRALAEGGRSDVIFDMNNQSSRPGYGYQLKMGATSLTEAWDANPADSQNHFMLGQIMEWFYGDLAGISSDPAGPGFKRIIIRPQPVGDLTWVKASYDSTHGRIASDWEKNGGAFTLHLEVPVNTTATVYLPARNAGTVTEGGRLASEAACVHFVRQENDKVIYEVNSGKYEFVSK
jgi:hypothetical protein